MWCCSWTQTRHKGNGKAIKTFKNIKKNKWVTQAFLIHPSGRQIFRSESHLLGKVGNFGRKRLDSSSDSLNEVNVLEENIKPIKLWNQCRKKTVPLYVKCPTCCHLAPPSSACRMLDVPQGTGGGFQPFLHHTGPPALCHPRWTLELHTMIQCG